MAITEDNITDDIYETAKMSIDYIKVKTGMPSNVDGELMRNFLKDPEKKMIVDFLLQEAVK